jgi:hypothetical protein
MPLDGEGYAKLGEAFATARELRAHLDAWDPRLAEYMRDAMVATRPPGCVDRRWRSNAISVPSRCRGDGLSGRLGRSAGVSCLDPLVAGHRQPFGRLPKHRFWIFHFLVNPTEIHYGWSTRGERRQPLSPRASRASWSRSIPWTSASA